MARLNWGMIGGGEGSQIGPAHRLGAQADGNFVLVAGALDADPAKGRAYAERLGVRLTAPMATGARCWRASGTVTIAWIS
jgi:predicted dehydrogenase